MRLTLDRVEGEKAVFEDARGGMCEYSARCLPDGSTDGDVFDVRILPWKGSAVFVKNAEETGKRSAHISGLLCKIKNKRYKDEN